MLKLFVPGIELFDESTEEFVYSDDTVLELEHSLVSLSKWESIWKKPFMASEKSTEETLSYVNCMSLVGDISQEVFSRMTEDNFREINEYINDTKTATWFAEDKNDKSSRDVITSELIYYWMFTVNIPIECENWHLGRLITLIKVFSKKNQPEKKMSTQEIARRNRELNAARRQKYKTRG